MKQAYWFGTLPAICNKCGNKCENLFYDAKHPGYGRWGLFCHSCFRTIGGKTGTGLGQKYKKADDGNFYKVEG